MHPTKMLSYYFSTAWVCRQFISHPAAITIAPLLPGGFQMTIFSGHYDSGDFKVSERVLYREGLKNRNMKTFCSVG